MSRHDDFWEQLAYGEEAETQISKWLNLKDDISVMRVWAKIDNGNQVAPKVKLHDNYYSTPDIQIFQGDKISFVEVKREVGFTKYRVRNKWQLSMDYNKYTEYRIIQRAYNIPVNVFFLVDGEKVEGTNQLYKKGLWSMPLDTKPDHDHNTKNTKTGKYKKMVYWNEEDLTPLADYDYVMSL